MGFNFPNTPIVGQVYAPGGAGIPSYKWDGEKWTTQGAPLNKTPVYTDGSTPMTAQLTLFADPVALTDAADKNYVDNADASNIAGKAVRYDIAQGLNTGQKAQGRANIDVLKKNYLINGAMMVSQENGATVGAAANGYFAADQWPIYTNVGVVSFAQVAVQTPSGSPNRLRATVTTAKPALAAGDYSFIRQGIEGLRIADLCSGSAAAKTITFSFGCRGPAGTYCAYIENGVAVNRTYIAEFVITAGEANTDVVKSVTVRLDQTGTWPTDNTCAMYIGICLGAGATYQTPAGAWAAGNFFASANQFNFFGTNGNVFELFDVQLVEGTVAPSFQVPHYADALHDCLRYYWREAAPTWMFSENVSSGVASNTLNLPVQFPVPMRQAPALTLPTFTVLNCGAPAAGTAAPTLWGACITAVSNSAAGSRMYFLYGSGAFVANARI